MNDDRYQMHRDSECDPPNCRWCLQEAEIQEAGEAHERRLYRLLQEELRRAITGDSDA